MHKNDDFNLLKKWGGKVKSPRPQLLSYIQQYNGWIEAAMESSIRVLVNRDPDAYDGEFLQGNYLTWKTFI